MDLQMDRVDIMWKSFIGRKRADDLFNWSLGMGIAHE